MTKFNEGDTVKLVRSNTSAEGMVGTVTRTGDYRTFIKITEVPENYTVGYFSVGGILSSAPNHFELVKRAPVRVGDLLQIEDLQIGDKIKVSRIGKTGTEQVVTGVVHTLGRPGTHQSAVRSEDRIALAFRAVEDGTSELWASQTIELLDRPVPKFDPFGFGMGTVATYDHFGTDAVAVKQNDGTWTVVINGHGSATIFSDDLASMDADAVTVLAAK